MTDNRKNPRFDKKRTLTTAGLISKNKKKKIRKIHRNIAIFVL